MSKQAKLTGAVSPEEQALADAMSAWAESDEFDIPDTAEVRESDHSEEAGRPLLEAAMGKEALDEAIGRGGRPGLDGTAGNGPSPKRQVRLTRDLDARLTEFVTVVHRDRSEVMREALGEYLERHTVTSKELHTVTSKERPGRKRAKA